MSYPRKGVSSSAGAACDGASGGGAWTPAFAGVTNGGAWGRRHERASLQGSRRRRRPRRLCRGDPRGPARPRHDPGRSGPARRHVPQRRLHSLEGADPRRGRGAFLTRAAWAERYRAVDRAAETRFRPHDRLEGFDRRQAHQRRRRPSEEGQGAHAPRDGDDRRRQDGDRPRRHRRDPHRRPSISSLRPARSRSNCRRSSSAATSCLRPMRWR